MLAADALTPGTLRPMLFREMGSFMTYCTLTMRLLGTYVASGHWRQIAFLEEQIFNRRKSVNRDRLWPFPSLMTI